MADRTWRLPRGGVSLTELVDAAKSVAASYEGVSVEVEDEGEGIFTCFFRVPVPADPDDEDLGEFAEDDEGTVEISVYELEKGAVLMCLEDDASDNDWLEEEADRLADDLAGLLDAAPLDL